MTATILTFKPRAVPVVELDDIFVTEETQAAVAAIMAEPEPDEDAQ